MYPQVCRVAFADIFSCWGSERTDRLGCRIGSETHCRRDNTLGFKHADIDCVTFRDDEDDLSTEIGEETPEERLKTIYSRHGRSPSGLGGSQQSRLGSVLEELSDVYGGPCSSQSICYQAQAEHKVCTDRVEKEVLVSFFLFLVRICPTRDVTWAATPILLLKLGTMVG